LYGQQLIGQNLFKKKYINKDDLALEVVRVINSLNYQARKLLINKELNRENKNLMIKWCIYGVMYFLAFYDIYPKTRGEALKIFYIKFKPKLNPSIFLKIKVRGIDNMTIADIRKAYDFLQYLELLIMKNYKKAA
jgi:hypothetical protein